MIRETSTAVTLENIPILSGFINSFMETGIFPKILKIGKVTPVYKKGDPQLFDNYRPIFGKIFEKIIYLYIQDFIASLHLNR